MEKDNALRIVPHPDLLTSDRKPDVLAESEGLFRGTFENANVGMAHVALDGQFLRANACLCRLLGRDQAELATIRFQDITHSDDLGTDLHLLNEVLAGSRDSYTMEKRYIRPDGKIVWADLSVSLLRDRKGQPVSFISVISDIQARKEAQDQLQLVLAEANHRVKNLLSVVSAIVTSSVRSASSAEQLGDAIGARLKGIAASHDLLMGKSANGGSLAQLVRRQIEIFTDRGIDRVQISGPEIQLVPSAVQAFGMVLHELATNACKYGALSNASGCVLVSWALDPAREELSFSWTERDGPPVPTPDRQGFGSRALLRMLAGLGGKATFILAPEGACFEAVVPLASTISCQSDALKAAQT